MQKKTFFSKVLQMAGIMLLFNISGICYSIYISERVGPQSMGLFHLIMNVQYIGISLSVSGMSLTATRLLSDMPRDRALSQANGIMKKCIAVCLATSVTASVVMFVCAEPIAGSLLGDPRCAMAIRIISPTLICYAVSAVIGGYFTAFGKVAAMGTGRMCGEIINWSLTFFLIRHTPKEYLYYAIITSGAASVIIECLCDIVLWQKCSLSFAETKTSISCKTVIKLCAPLAIGSYLRTGLVSAENLLIPPRLAAGGVNNALSQYGILKGMTMPVMTFPSVFVGAFATLIVPEIARRLSVNHTNSIRYISSLSIQYILKFAILISAVLFIWGKDICGYLFSEPDAGEFLHLLFVMPIFMFLDSVIDAILKGLNQQIFSLKINITDSVMRVVLIIMFVPVFKLKAYIAIMYVSEILNLTASYYRLKKTTSLRFPIVRAIIFPILSLGCALGLVRLLPVGSLVSEILLFSAAYIGFGELLFAGGKQQ